MRIHTGHSLSPEGFSSKTPMASSFKSLLLDTFSAHFYKNNLCHPYPVGLIFILWVSDLLSVSPARRYVCIKQVLFSILSSTNSRDNTVAGTYRCSITIVEWVNSFFFFFIVNYPILFSLPKNTKVKIRRRWVQDQLCRWLASWFWQSE